MKKIKKNLKRRRKSSKTTSKGVFDDSYIDPEQEKLSLVGSPEAKGMYKRFHRYKIITMAAVSILLIALLICLTLIFTSRASASASANASVNASANVSDSGEEVVPSIFSLTPEITEVLPHEDSCFTQGLIFNDVDGLLYESCGLYHQSKLRQVDPSTGQVLQSVDLDPSLFAEGIHIVGDDLLMITWKEKKLLVFDWKTLTLRSTHPFTTTRKEGWGITGNSTTLMVTDGSQWIHFWDINDYTNSPTGRRIQVTRLVYGRQIPVPRLNEVEFLNNNEILANVFMTREIVSIDPNTGVVRGSYLFDNILEEFGDPSGRPDVLNGIAFDKSKRDVYITGKLWKSMFKFKI